MNTLFLSSDLLQLILLSTATIFLYMTLWHLLSVLLKRYDIADIAWGLGFIIIAWLGLLMQPEQTAHMMLITGLITVWGLRLAIHILLRNKTKKEDHRYAQWRKEWGKLHALRAYFQVFLFQGLLMLIIATPVYIVSVAPTATLGMLEYGGAALWLLGFFFETIGDYQLMKFKKDPANKGKIMQTGLWKYTRHPNYFGEVTQWWGIFLIAVSTVNGLYAIISPITITFLILKISGIPMLERKYQGDAEFEAYKKRTSAFFPLPPKKN